MPGERNAGGAYSQGGCGVLSPDRRWEAYQQRGAAGQNAVQM